MGNILNNIQIQEGSNLLLSFRDRNIPIGEKCLPELEEKVKNCQQTIFFMLIVHVLQMAVEGFGIYSTQTTTHFLIFLALLLTDILLFCLHLHTATVYEKQELVILRKLKSKAINQGVLSSKSWCFNNGMSLFLHSYLHKTKKKFFTILLEFSYVICLIILVDILFFKNIGQNEKACLIVMMCLLIIHLIAFAISVYVYYFRVKRVATWQTYYQPLEVFVRGRSDSQSLWELLALGLVTVFAFRDVFNVGELEQDQQEIDLREWQINVDRTKPDQCAICCSDYKDDPELIQLPCNKDHIFHKKCISGWIKGHNTCPLCRARLY